jgi:site-specific DNA recombinase
MGGLVPLGYDPHPDPNRRELVINAAEAETVRRLFALYPEHGCLNATADAAEAAGLRSKRRVFAHGRAQGGGAFTRGQIHKILTNPVYRSLTRHKDKTWPDGPDSGSIAQNTLLIARYQGNPAKTAPAELAN